MLLAQITDLHVSLPGTLLDRHYHTAALLERAVEHLLALDPRPDAVAITGDLVDVGSPGEYARLVELLAPLPMPVHVVPGNHDERDNLRAAFGPRGYLPATGFLCYEADVGPVRLLALDTNIPGATGGRLCAERLAWLEARLAEGPDRPTMVLQHHPPFATGLRGMDSMNLDGGEAEAEVIARHPQVERVLCGHVHRAITRRFAGTLASTCPSTAYQVELDLRPHVRVAVIREPPACALHTWSEAAGLVSHLSFIGDHGPAQVVYEPDPQAGAPSMR
jgi:3',5'-cyclic-AMP phosphodiesterase